MDGFKALFTAMFVLVAMVSPAFAVDTARAYVSGWMIFFGIMFFMGLVGIQLLEPVKVLIEEFMQDLKDNKD